MGNSFEKKTAEIENLLKAIKENKPVEDVKPGQGIRPDLSNEMMQSVEPDGPVTSNDLIKEIDNILYGSAEPAPEASLFDLVSKDKNEHDNTASFCVDSSNTPGKEVNCSSPRPVVPVEQLTEVIDLHTGNSSEDALTAQDDVFVDLSFEDKFQIDSKFFSFEDENEPEIDLSDSFNEEIFEEPIEEVENDLRSFFGKTIVIDESLEKNNDNSKGDIRNFVGRDKSGGTLYAEDGSGDYLEYQSDEDTVQLQTELKKYKLVYFIRLVINIFLTISSLVVNYMINNGEMFMHASVFSLYCYISAGILAVSFAVNFSDLISELGKILAFKKGNHSLLSLLYVAAIAGMIIKGIFRTDFIQASFAVVPLTYSIVGSVIIWLNAKRIFSNFCLYSAEGVKSIAGYLGDDSLSIRLMRTFSPSSVNVLVRGETEFADGFLGNSFSESSIGEGIGRISSFFFIISLAIGGLTYYFTKEIFVSVQSLVSSLTLLSPLSSVWCRLFPICRLQWNLSRYGTVVPGYSTCEELRCSDSVILDGREIFPDGNVKLTGIKTFDKEPIDKAIIYAASVLSYSDSTIADVFLKVIQNDTDMLLNVDGVEYEKGLGYSYWAENRRILLGTRVLMQTHEIDIPSLEFEKRYTKKENRSAVYLSVGGRLFAMFVVSYSPNLDVRNNIISLLNRGVNILVKTRDFNITNSSISLVYRIPERYLSVMNETNNSDIEGLLYDTAHREAFIIGDSSFDSFCHTITAAFNIKGIASMMCSIELVGLIVGLLFVAVILLFGSFTNVSALSVIGFQFIWLVLPIATGMLRKL